METYIRSGEHYTKEFSENLNVEIGDTRTTHGTAYTASHIAVPRYDPATASKHVAFGFAPDDVPGHPVPATIEQIEFLAALHEAEHTMLERKPVIADKNSPVRQQAWEIDADSAVVQPSTILKTRRSRNIGCRPETSSRFRPGLRDVS